MKIEDTSCCCCCDDACVMNNFERLSRFFNCLTSNNNNNITHTHQKSCFTRNLLSLFGCKIWCYKKYLCEYITTTLQSASLLLLATRKSGSGSVKVVSSVKNYLDILFVFDTIHKHTSKNKSGSTLVIQHKIVRKNVILQLKQFWRR